MKLAIRCLYYKAVNPSCDILEMDHDTWIRFLHSAPDARKQIALTLLGMEYMSYRIKEIFWMPLDNQNKLIEISPEINKESIFR